ncbi:hypothetical protein OGZ01_18760 [Vibrio harveyi]|nr:hypothetical protein [Vibrio harveyi]
MKFQYSFIAISLALAGCGGGSGGDTAAPTYNVAGTIAAQGTLLDTPVCIDLNQRTMFVIHLNLVQKVIMLVSLP